MRVYLDICAIKRPWDDQRQPRVRLESEAVALILNAAAHARIHLIACAVHVAENALNPDRDRRVAVDEWLVSLGVTPLDRDDLRATIPRFESSGLKGFDAAHAAAAHMLRADRFITTDDRLITRAAKVSDRSFLPRGPLEFAGEVLRWRP